MNTICKRRLWILLAGGALILLGSLDGRLVDWPAGAQAQEPPPEMTAEAATTETNEPTEAATGSESDESHIDRPVSERVSIGGGLRVREDEIVREVVTVFGASEVAGTVTREMVTIFGNAEMSGSVNREMVTVFGNAEVDGPVGRECVVVFGNLKLGPNAKVGRECVAVFGSVDRHPDAVLEHEPVSVLPMFSGLGDWLRDGLLMGRLIPPGSRIAWIIVALHFLVYGLIALLLPRPVKSTVDQLEAKPVLSFGVGVLTMTLLVPLYVILAATGVGVVLIPFIGLAETALVLLGKTSTFGFFGLQILRGVGRPSGSAPLVEFTLGFLLVTLLYMVPILGLLVWMILRPLALGAAVLACMSGMRRNGNGNASGVPVAPGIQGLTAAAAFSGSPPKESSVAGVPLSKQPAPAREGVPPSLSADESNGVDPETPPLPSMPTAPPLEVAVMPRAGFWIRLTATALDFIALCWILMLPHLDSFFFFFWIAYHIGMWSWKGTTIGGIVCNLKVVRLDGKNADMAVCLVRGLASIFSLLPLLLGFFWVGWTRERQSWHDKIAGTVIVRVPKGISLI